MHDPSKRDPSVVVRHARFEKRGLTARLKKLELYKIEADRQLANKEVRRTDLRNTVRELHLTATMLYDFRADLAKALGIKVDREKHETIPDTATLVKVAEALSSQLGETRALLAQADK